MCGVNSQVMGGTQTSGVISEDKLSCCTPETCITETCVLERERESGLCVCVCVRAAGEGKTLLQADTAFPSDCCVSILPVSWARTRLVTLDLSGSFTSHTWSRIPFRPSDAYDPRGCLPSPFLTPSCPAHPDSWRSLTALLPGFSLALFSSLSLPIDLPKKQLWPCKSSAENPSKPVAPHGLSEIESQSVVSDSLRPHGLYCPWNSPGQNTRVGSLSLLQGVFPTQGSNPGLPHCRSILSQLSHKGSPHGLRVKFKFTNRTPKPPWAGPARVSSVFPCLCSPCKSESEVTQSCLTLCDPMDYSLPGSSVHGVFLARILQWVAIFFSRGSSPPRDRTRVSCIAVRHFTVWATRGVTVHGVTKS